MRPHGQIIGGIAITTEDQADVIRFLENGAGFGSRAERIDTHGAIVFLIGETAIKIKRAVLYDYMDLSTQAKRHALLLREIALNKPAAPSIYEDVIPIVRRADGALALGGPGEVLEWALKMKRFPRQDELDQIALSDGIDDALAESLGVSIAAYHASAPLRQQDGALLIKDILDELDRVFGAMTGPISSAARTFAAQSLKIWEAHSNGLRARSQAGHVRRCHGDLHLRNIVLIDGIPTPFDALEFDERLGTCDTLYDLAFLLMDLDHLGMGHAANVVLNAYLPAASPDLADAGLSHLPLYLGIRAAIRAMVETQTAAFAPQHHDPARDAFDYIARALTYLRPRPPLLVAIGGLSGTGKTTVARAVAHRIGAAPGAIVVRSDVERKALLHRDPLAPLGPEGYSTAMTDRTYARIRAQARQVIDQGHAVVLDAVHGNGAARQETEQLARDAGCGFVGIWLDADADTRAARVASRGPDASDADVDVVRQQTTTDPGAMTWHRVAADRSIDAVVAAVLAVLPRAPIVARPESGGRNVG